MRQQRNLWFTAFYYYILISITFILIYIAANIFDQWTIGKSDNYDEEEESVQEGMKKMKFPTPKEISKEISKNVGKPIQKGIDKAAKETKKGAEKAMKETKKGFDKMGKEMKSGFAKIFKPIACVFNKIGNTTCWKFYFLSLLGHILYIPFYIIGGISKTAKSILDMIWDFIYKIDRMVSKYLGGYHLVKFPDDIRKKCFKC